jgi:hypothetical protein
MFTKKPPDHLEEWQKELHPSWRRYTVKYRRKRRIVRDMWIVSGLMMVNLSLGAVFAMALLTALLSFMILDETA